MVGDYFDGGPVAHSFIKTGSTYAPLDDPAATSIGTYASGINKFGEVVGGFFGSGPHGFLYSGGTFTTLDDPSGGSTFAGGINDQHKIVGFFDDGLGEHGFILKGGVYTTFDVPGASATDSVAINNEGQIAGYFTDASGDTHGFVATPTPEPAVWAMMLIGIFGVGSRLRSGRRRQTAAAAA